MVKPGGLTAGLASIKPLHVLEKINWTFAVCYEVRTMKEDLQR